VPAGAVSPVREVLKLPQLEGRNLMLEIRCPTMASDVQLEGRNLMLEIRCPTMASDVLPF